MLAVGPLFLSWSYLKHGVLNRPAGHVMMNAKQPPAMASEDKSARDLRHTAGWDLESGTEAPSSSSSTRGSSPSSNKNSDEHSVSSTVSPVGGNPSSKLVHL